MSLNRYAKKRDLAEAPIIQALERAGFEVWTLDQPVDLACRRSSWPPGLFQLLEVKTGQGKKGNARIRKTQTTQNNFIASTQTPIVRTPIEALRAIGAVST